MKLNRLSSESLNKFLVTCRQAEFLQTPAWADFQKRLGNKAMIYGVLAPRSPAKRDEVGGDNDEIIASALVIEKQILGLKYWYCPRGPIVKDELRKANYEIIDFLFAELKKIAKQERVVFLRYEPTSEIRNPKSEIRTIDIQPSKTLIVDLAKSEQELLNSFHHKTRYNIKLAEKKGVVVEEYDGQNWDEIWQVMLETKKRDKFSIHSAKHYQALLNLSVKEEVVTPKGVTTSICRLYLAKHGDKILALGFFIFYKDTVTYVHGASSDTDRQLMAPYLLHWRVMQLVKKQEFLHYDLFGIDEQKWPGVTRFKRGFAEKELIYPGTFDLIFSPRYYKLYQLARRLRRWF